MRIAMVEIFMQFRFSDLSIMQLIDKLTFLNGNLGPDRKIILGDSCELVTIQRMVQLMIAANGKAHVDYSKVDWKGIMRNTKERGRVVDKMADGSSITHHVNCFVILKIFFVWGDVVVLVF